MTDTEIIDWMEAHADTVHLEHVPAHDVVNALTKKKVHIEAYWRRVFGRKDSSNMFPTLRAAVEALAKEK